MLLSRPVEDQPRKNPSNRFDSVRLRLSDNEIITRCGLDAFLFLRYLKALLRIFVPLAVIVLPVLIPLNYIGGKGPTAGVTGLDQFSWTNISASHTKRHWAHLILALVIVLWVCHICSFELLSFTHLRHEWLSSLYNHKDTSMATILVTDIPPDLLSQKQLYNLYKVYPYGVRDISINRDHTALISLIEKRDRLVLALESSESKLIKKAQMSQDIRAGKAMRTDTVFKEEPLWRRYLGPNEREKVRLPPRWSRWGLTPPFVGTVVDKIDHYRVELKIMNSYIAAERLRAKDHRIMNSAFVQFNRPLGAHLACQAVEHFKPNLMTARLVEGTSTDVLWQRISMSWWERYIRAFITGILLGALIVICTVPVAFTGALAQINYLIVAFPTLNWLERSPRWVLISLQGIFPPCLLALVMISVPLILYQFVAQHGVYLQVDKELLVQDYYFYFLLIQLFVVVSGSSSVATMLDGYNQGLTSVASLLAQTLPKTSNYFFSYMLLQALSVSAATLLQTGRLLSFLSGFILDRTPRQK